MQKSTETKLARAIELKQVIEDAQNELDSLFSPEKAVILPTDFSMNNEVLSSIKQAGEEGVDLKKILYSMQSSFPRYGINRQKIASALAYLKNGKKVITQVGRGVYKAL